MLTLADGRVVTDRETSSELAASPGGPVQRPIDLTSAQVARTVQLGAEFQFTFDFGDDWTHRCVVGQDKIDPMEELGIRPSAPLPYWGWGTIPDQYGRVWADDDGEHRPPGRPQQTHPMLVGKWPDQQQLPTPDLPELRRAIAGRDADRMLTAVSGCDIDDVLQQVGVGVPILIASGSEQAEAVALSVINRLTLRAGPGDDVLAADLLAALRGEPTPGRAVPVDLEMLSMEVEGDAGMSSGGYLDLHTGQVYGEESPGRCMAKNPSTR